MTRTAARTTAAADATWARRGAVLSGVAGVIANVLLVLLYALASPLSAGPRPLAWLGAANDAVVAVQFAAFPPVALALAHRLPQVRGVRLATAVGVAAMAATVVLQLLLVTRVLPFAVQFPAVSAVLVVVYLWLLTVSLVGHRTATLPRPVTRFGLLIGWSLPAGALIVAAGLLVPDPARWVLFVPGGVVGVLGWFALPAMPLLVHRHVLTKEKR